MKILKKRVDAANGLLGHENQLRNIKTQLTMIKTQVENLKTVIDGDSDFLQSDKDFMQAVYNLVNHTKYGDFVAFIQTNVG